MRVGKHQKNAKAMGHSLVRHLQYALMAPDETTPQSRMETTRQRIVANLHRPLNAQHLPKPLMEKLKRINDKYRKQ